MNENMNDIVIMRNDPLPNKTPTDVRNYFAERKTEKDLADAYAISHNKFGWVEDDAYDYEEGTPEYEAARVIVDEWGALIDEYEERIFMILRGEGIKIPKTGRIKVLKPFMERHDYIDGNGWWIKAKG